MEINPYSNFKEFDEKIETLSRLAEIQPKDTNIQYLLKLTNEIPIFNIKKSDYYYYAYYLSVHLKKEQKVNKEYFAPLNYWLVNTDESFGLLDRDIMNEVWRDRDDWSINNFADLMLAFYLASKGKYLEFIEGKKSELLDFLTVQTNSVRIEENINENSLYVEYILMPTDYDRGNEESVKRLNLLCKSLPIYDFYQSESIQPKLQYLKDYDLIDDSFKKMLKRNIIITFHQEFAKLWGDTILANYEAPTVFDWINHWNNIRWDIVELLRKNIQWIERLLNRQGISNNALREIDSLRDKIESALRMDYPYPGEKRPFEKSKYIPTDQSKIKKNRYFTSIGNYINQMVGLVLRDEKNSRLAKVNLLYAKNQLEEMQEFFNQTIMRSGHQFKSHSDLNKRELESIEKMYVYNIYYQNHPNSRVATDAMISSWYSNNSTSLIHEIKQKIEIIKAEEIKIIYPDEVIEENVLCYLPLLVENANILSDEYNGKLIFSLLPVIDFDIDFIIIMLVDESGTMVEEQGIRISKDYLEAVNISIAKDNNTALEKQNPPYPEEVKIRYLKAFKPSYYGIS